MSEQSQKLREMNLEIQQERADVKEEGLMLNERRRKLKDKETEYLSLSLEEFSGTSSKKVLGGDRLSPSH